MHFWKGCFKLKLQTVYCWNKCISVLWLTTNTQQLLICLCYCRNTWCSKLKNLNRCRIKIHRLQQYVTDVHLVNCKRKHQTQNYHTFHADLPCESQLQCAAFKTSNQPCPRFCIVLKRWANHSAACYRTARCFKISGEHWWLWQALTCSLF